MADTEKPGVTEGAEPVTIKKYANRRLYNTSTSSYVTLEHLAKMVREGIDFVVRDAKTGEDITRSVLTQIIVEEEAKGTNLLPISFLRQLIGFYGDSLQSLVPQYLEVSMRAFTKNQEEIRQYLKTAFGGMFPFNQLDELGRQNVAMFERAMQMFTPFAPGAPGAPGRNGPAAEASPRPEADRDLEDMKARLEQMQRQLDAISPKKEG
ncbi:MAG: polyhydroxyalkanoate synthesis repressor PhaR [Rhodospirillales bacterium]